MIPHIRWTVGGRSVQPFSFAVALSCIVLVWAFTSNLAVGRALDGLPGDVLAVVALAAAVLLSVGWWARRPRWQAAGMFLSSGTWFGVFAVLMGDVGWGVSTALAGTWLIACSGAWLIETDALRARR